MTGKTFGANWSWWSIHVSDDLFRGHRFDYSLLPPLTHKHAHTSRQNFWARVARKLAFWFRFPWRQNQCGTRHFWGVCVVGWCCAEMSWNIGLLCVFVCVAMRFVCPPRAGSPSPCFHLIFFQSTPCFFWTLRNIWLFQCARPLCEEWLVQVFKDQRKPRQWCHV